MVASDGSFQVGQPERPAARFAEYFRELRQAFLERDDVLTQIALALLAREHVLLVGPPGTAKSQLARAVLGRILDATTGEPSLFARQFTENTVLTDLVGPIDFKTLMETGRSQHFTDEGVIGSVHAFLDEVFDGRDMLLRSTLNLLGERELKQGKSTVRGRIEGSLMTSNRYLSEVLEESRESLLAFVDRIAFVGFVPKGFSSDAPMRQVLRQSLTGGAAPLHAYLTIQDLDVLQDLVERVRVAPEASDRLVAFLALFEREMAAAVRAIPDFTPSRYLSIRTRVRAGKLLKAIVVYRKVVESPQRPLEVLPEDFEQLRLVLLQSGPPTQLLERLAHEQDPREARQLKIIKTERDVFERCLLQLDRTPFRPPPTAGVLLEPAAWAAASLEALLELSERAADGPDAPAQLLAELEQTILARVIEQGLSVSAPQPDSLQRHAELLDRVERMRGPVDPLVRFLRGRGVATLESAVEGEILRLEALSESRAGRGAVATLGLLSPVLERLHAWSNEAEGIRRSAPHLSLERLRQLLGTAAAAMISRLREAFLVEARETTLDPAEPWNPETTAALRLRAALDAVHAFEARLSPFDPACAALLDTVVAPAVAPLTERALAPLAPLQRDELLPAFDAIWGTLAKARVTRHLPLKDVLATTLKHAVAQDERAWAKLGQGQKPELSAAGHEELRRCVPRSLLCFVALQLCLRLDAASVERFAKDGRLDTFAARLAELPESLLLQLRQHDVKRLGSWLDFLSGWLARAEAKNAAPGEVFQLLGVLEREGAATRIRLETELIEAVLPAASPECEALRARSEALLRRVRELIGERAGIA